MIKIDGEVILKPLNEIKPYLKNPRSNEKTVDLLTKIIPVVGFNVPIVIDKKGVIIKGHARYAAAMRLGMEEVPCIVSTASAKAIKADRLTDNKIQEFTSWNSSGLREEVGDIDFEALGISASEFGLEDVDFDVLTHEDLEGGPVEPKKNRNIIIKMHFKDAEEFREHEEEIRSFMDTFDRVDIEVGNEGE